MRCVQVRASGLAGAERARKLDELRQQRAEQRELSSLLSDFNKGAALETRGGGGATGKDVMGLWMRSWDGIGRCVLQGTLVGIPGHTPPPAVLPADPPQAAWAPAASVLS